MRAKRRFDRFLKQREAKYLSQEGLRIWQECTIINVSRKGMKILFHERINVDSTICLEIPVPGELVSISINGVLKWIEERGNDFIGGIELTKMLDDEKLSKLLISYRLSQKKINTKIIKEVIEDMNTHTEETFPSLISKQHFTLSSFKKVFSLKSVEVSLFSLLLLLSLPLFFLMVRGYFSSLVTYSMRAIKKKIWLFNSKKFPSALNPLK